MTKMTAEDMRQITRLALAEADRKAQAAAAKHRARPENRSARLRAAESEVKAAAPRDQREVYSYMERHTKPVRAKPAAKTVPAPCSLMNKAGLLEK